MPAPLLDELPVLGKLHHSRVPGPDVMAVGNEDVPVRRDSNVVGLIESVLAVARDARFAKRHQHLSIRAKLEHLMPLAITPLSIRDPQVAGLVDADAVRKY